MPPTQSSWNPPGKRSFNDLRYGTSRVPSWVTHLAASTEILSVHLEKHTISESSLQWFGFWQVHSSWFRWCPAIDFEKDEGWKMKLHLELLLRDLPPQPMVTGMVSMLPKEPTSSIVPNVHEDKVSSLEQKLYSPIIKFLRKSDHPWHISNTIKLKFSHGPVDINYIYFWGPWENLSWTYPGNPSNLSSSAAGTSSGRGSRRRWASESEVFSGTVLGMSENSRGWWVILGVFTSKPLRNSGLPIPGSESWSVDIHWKVNSKQFNIALLQ